MFAIVDSCDALRIKQGKGGSILKPMHGRFGLFDIRGEEHMRASLNSYVDLSLTFKRDNESTEWISYDTAVLNAKMFEYSLINNNCWQFGVQSKHFDLQTIDYCSIQGHRPLVTASLVNTMWYPF